MKIFLFLIFIIFPSLCFGDYDWKLIIKSDNGDFYVDMKSLKIKRVFVVGLALDFCVQYTALDSANLGYKTYVIEDATYPVDIGNSVKEALNNFKKNNVGFGKLEEFI